MSNGGVGGVGPKGAVPLHGSGVPQRPPGVPDSFVWIRGTNPGVWRDGGENARANPNEYRAYVSGNLDESKLNDILAGSNFTVVKGSVEPPNKKHEGLTRFYIVPK
jgi:hypothetical protein